MSHPTHDQGILNSLEYLSKEAKLSGDQSLHIFIKTVIDTTRKKNAGVITKEQDIEFVIEFLTLYQSATPPMRKKVLSIINTFDLAN